MKELYNFVAKRPVEKEETYIKKVKGKEVEATRNKTIIEKTHLVFVKPSVGELENAEFFYGQQFNKLVSSGFLTRAMLQKRFDEISNVNSINDDEEVKNSLNSYLEAVKVIEFYEGQKDLTKDKEELLKRAKENFLIAQEHLTNFQTNMSAQFAQTADVKAEQKLIEWLMLHFLYIKEDQDGTTQYFPFFEGANYSEKRNFYLTIQDDLEDENKADLIKRKSLLDNTIDEIVQVITVWNAGLGKDEKEIRAKIKELFGE